VEGGSEMTKEIQFAKLEFVIQLCRSSPAGGSHFFHDGMVWSVDVVLVFQMSFKVCNTGAWVLLSAFGSFDLHGANAPLAIAPNAVPRPARVGPLRRHHFERESRNPKPKLPNRELQTATCNLQSAKCDDAMTSYLIEHNQMTT
jgi:hypothetical protein